VWWTQRLYVPFALCFYPRSLGELSFVGSSAHYGIRLFGLYRGAAIFFFFFFYFLAAFPEGWTKFALRSHLQRSEARSGSNRRGHPPPWGRLAALWRYLHLLRARFAPSPLFF
jgi:hypothetical protein